MIIGTGLFPSTSVIGDSNLLSDVLGSVVFDLDATIADSYPGSGQTWMNLTQSPADGSLQTDYDFQTGDGVTSTTYPTFIGTPGDPAAYWELDGGDWFSRTANINGFIRSAVRSDLTGGYWIAFAFRTVTTNTRALFATKTSPTSSSVGVSVYTQGSLRTIHHGQGNGPSASNISSGVNLTSGADNVIIFSRDRDNNLDYWWINTPTGISVAHSYVNYVVDQPATTDLFAFGTSATQLSSGDRVYSMAGGNELLDDTKAAAIISTLEARHNRVYI